MAIQTIGHKLLRAINRKRNYAGVLSGHGQYEQKHLNMKKEEECCSETLVFIYQKLS
jgi:hypothetical protein